MLFIKVKFFFDVLFDPGVGHGCLSGRSPDGSGWFQIPELTTCGERPLFRIRLALKMAGILKSYIPPKVSFGPLKPQPPVLLPASQEVVWASAKGRLAGGRVPIAEIQRERCSEPTPPSERLAH